MPVRPPAPMANADLAPVALRAEVDLGAIRHNARVLRAMAGDARLMAVVKADAYGHGALPVARALADEGVTAWAVATVPEGAELRAGGVEGEILVLGAPLPDHLPAYVRHQLSVAVTSAGVAEHAVAAAATYGPLRAHLKVDTGMHRLGVQPEAAPELARLLRDAPGVSLDGVWSHLATADGELGVAREQAERFRLVVDEVRARVGAVRVHLANGPGLARAPGAMPLGPDALARVGGVLYGMASSPETEAAYGAAGLRPAMRLTSRVVHLQTVGAGDTVSYGRTWTAAAPTRIATVAGGYADGIPRGLSNRGEIGIGGAGWPIAGRVCMDMLLVDLGAPDGPGGQVAVGDEAVVFGSGGPSVEAQAARAGTMAYELTAGLTGRVVHAYTGRAPQPRAAAPADSAPA